MPDIPTVVEAGMPALVAENFIGVSAPAGLPAPTSRRGCTPRSRTRWTTRTFKPPARRARPDRAADVAGGFQAFVEEQVTAGRRR